MKKTIEDILKKMPKAHPGIEEWIYTFCAEGSYMIYDRKWGTAVCTRCGKKIPAEEWMRHNEYGECPKCGSSVQYKAAGRGRNNLWETFRILECSHKGKTVWICSWEIRLDFKGFGRPEISRFLADVFIINDKEEHHYKHEISWNYEHCWNEVKTMRLPHASGGAVYGYNNPPLETVYVYRKNLEAVFTKSCIKYLWDRQFIEGLSAYQLVNYMSMGMKWQSVELLHKSGFQRLIMQRLNEESGSGACNWRGTCLQKILRLPMRDIRYIREHNPSFLELKTFRECPEDMRRQIPWELIQEIKTYRYPGDWRSEPGYSQWIRRLNEYTDLKQWIKYITQHQEDKSFTLDDWVDYIETAKKLGIDLRRKSNMYPEDFWKAHDEAAETVGYQKKDLQTKLLKRLKKEVRFENDKLTVKIATTQTQLNRESGSLHHCVKTYGDSLKNGKCLIFFVREKEHPEESFFTLETDVKGNFRQCRGSHNCSMPPEVKMFVDEFVKLNKKKKKIMKKRNQMKIKKIQRIKITIKII